MKLYYIKGACSFVPHTALEWAGIDYDAQAVQSADIKTPEYLALNPQGTVPLLVDGEFVLSQNLAILSYLDAKFPDALLFGSHCIQERAKTMRWLSFLNADLHKAFVPLFHPPSYVKETQFKADMQNHAQSEILRMLGQANSHLATQDYLTNHISVADVYLYVILRWCHRLNIDYQSLTDLPKFYQRVGDDAGVQAVLAKEGLIA